MKTQWCQTCGQKCDSETGLFVCPNQSCKGPLADHPREGAFNPEQRKELKRMIWEAIGIRVTVVGLIGALFLRDRVLAWDWNGQSGRPRPRRFGVQN